jgi:hypothetical protein
MDPKQGELLPLPLTFGLNYLVVMKSGVKSESIPVVLAPTPHGVSVSSITFSSNSSGLVAVSKVVRMPDGKDIKLLNRQVFGRALEKSNKAK